jgi:hypothetical protein
MNHGRQTILRVMTNEHSKLISSSTRQESITNHVATRAQFITGTR